MKSSYYWASITTLLWHVCPSTCLPPTSIPNAWLKSMMLACQQQIYLSYTRLHNYSQQPCASFNRQSGRAENILQATLQVQWNFLSSPSSWFLKKQQSTILSGERLSLIRHEKPFALQTKTKFQTYWNRAEDVAIILIHSNQQSLAESVVAVGFKYWPYNMYSK